MDIDKFRNFESLGDVRWDRTVQARPFANGRWMRFGEGVYPENEVYYHLLNAGDNRYAGAVSSIRRNEPLPIKNRVIRKIVSMYLRRRPLMTCQNHLGGFSGLFIQPSIRNPSEVIHRISSSMEIILRSYKGAFLIFPYLSSRIAALPGWGKEYFTVALPPGTEMNIQWKDFEEYIFSRKNSARKDYRLHANRAERMGLQTKILDSIPDITLAEKLIRKVERRHNAAANSAVGEILTKSGGVGGKWLIVEQDSHMVGCGLILKDQDAMLLTMLGLRPKVPQVYFSLMYGAIRFAIENEVKTLYGGGGAYYFKSRLGYRLMTNNYIKVYAGNEKLRKLGAYLAGLEGRDRAANWPAKSRAWVNLAFASRVKSINKGIIS